MKKLMIFMLTVVVFAACESKKSGEAEQSDTNTAIETPADNQLTAEEKSEGWKVLFNGENMDGWKTYKNKENDSWEVIDGTLHCKPDTAAKKRADILTIDQYRNFDLTFDWKVAPTDNSGVIYRATEEFDEPYLSGPEYQVIDDKGYPDALTPTQTSGEL